MPSKLIDPAELPTYSFDWGVIKPLVSEDIQHLVGVGDQMVDDGEPFPVRPGQAIWIPTAAFHSTLNTGWEPMVLLAIYAPAGAEQILKTLPDYREVPPGTAPPLVRS